MSSETAISVRGITKTYRIATGRRRESTLAATMTNRLRSPLARSPRTRFDALREVSFDVNAGEVLGIIGRNGAGKSTLLKILSRVTAPSSGHATLYGRVGSLLEVGTGFHPELTGRENIYLNGTILGMRRRDIARRFEEIVEFAGVARFLDTPVKRYSSGMYVRLAFSVAAHLDADILLVDEVLAVGDLEFQRKSLGKLESVAGSGRTVVFVSHSMETVSRLCNSALLLSEGAVQAIGPTRQVIERYVADPASAAASRNWAEATAPGDGAARLRSVRVTDDAGGSAQIDIRRPIEITVDYDVLQDDGGSPLVSLFVKNADGLILFATNSYHAGSQDVLPPAQLTATCIVPPNFLAEGRHLLTVGLNAHGVVHAYQDDVVSFEIVDPCQGDSVRGEWVGDWVGAVRPMLDWSIAHRVGTFGRPA